MADGARAAAPITARQFALGSLIAVASILLAAQSVRYALAWTPMIATGAVPIAAADGFLRQREARQLTIAGMPPNSIALPNQLPANVLALSVAAYRQEPFAGDALVLLGVAAWGHKDPARARALVRGAWALSRRSSLASAWLLQDYGRQAQIRPLMAVYDSLLRTNSAARATLLQPIVQALAAPASVPVVKRLLEKDPPWQDEFWAALADTPAALANGALLREQLRGRLRYNGRRDDPLFVAMARARLFPQVLRLYGAIAPRGAVTAGNLVKNGDFARDATGGPVDWAVFTDTDFGASIDRDRGQLIISSIDRGTGAVAQQLLDLTPGSYRIAARLDSVSDTQGTPIALQLSCQKGAGSSNLDWSLRLGMNARTFTVRPDCRFFYLTVMVRAGAGSAGIDAALGSISVARGEAGSKSI